MAGIPGFGEMLCVRLAGDARAVFIKWLYFLAVFKGVFDITYLIKKHPSGNLDTIALAVVGILERAKAAFQKSKKTHICIFIYLSYVSFEGGQSQKRQAVQLAGEAELAKQQVIDSPGLSAQEASTPSAPFHFPLGLKALLCLG